MTGAAKELKINYISIHFGRAVTKSHLGMYELPITGNIVKGRFDKATQYLQRP